MGDNIRKNLARPLNITFYGYRILAVTFICVLLYSGCGIISFSLFVVPLQSEFGWGRGQIMIAFTVLQALTGVASPFVGRLIDRYGARLIMSLGAFAGGLGFISLNLTQSIWHLYIGYFITAIGMASIGPVSSSTVVSNWFQRRRGTAIGVMSTGVGMGSFIMPLLVGGFLIPSFGWRASYLTLAILMWLLIPLVLVVVRTKPIDVGLYRDGVADSEGTAEPATSPSAPEKIGLKTALGTSVFWLIGITFFLQSFNTLGFAQNLAAYLQDAGYSLTIAASAVTASGLGSSVGKFAFGLLCDRIKAEYACAIGLGIIATGILLLMKVSGSSPLGLVWLYAFIFGLGAGGWLPTLSMLTSTKFGMASYATIFGTMTLMQNFGGAIGAAFTGYMYDIMNTYNGAFIVFLVLFTIAIPAILTVRRFNPLKRT